MYRYTSNNVILLVVVGQYVCEYTYALSYTADGLDRSVNRMRRIQRLPLMTDCSIREGILNNNTDHEQAVMQRVENP